jgi:hypothetical protein
VSLGPAALVRSLPGALGRTPADEVLVVGITALAPTVASVASVDVSGVLTDPDAEELATAATRAVAAALADGVTYLVIVAYADDARLTDSTAARTAATVGLAAEAAGLRVLDTIAVASGAWRSYDCTNPSCCPPEGTPILEGPTP